MRQIFSRPSRTAFALGLVAALLLAALPGCMGTTTTSSSTAASSDHLERAVTLLQVQARNEDPALRANSIEALQNLHDPRVTDVLEQGLGDPAPVVRFAAVMAAGKRQDLTLKPGLQQLFTSETNGSVKVALVYALTRLGDTTHLSLLGKTIDSPDADVRANTALVLGLLRDYSPSRVLTGHIYEKDVRVKFEIIVALARLGDRTAEDGVMGMSVNQFAEDYYTALTLCPELKRPEAVNMLLQGLRYRDLLRDASQDQKMIVERAALIAARGLGKMGRDDGRDIALDDARSSQPELRALAALALGDILLPNEQAPLVRLLDDREPHVQVAAAAGLVNLSARSAPATTRPTPQ